MHGILFINKPVGITSYDVVRRAKKVFKTRKIGHTGTLDPFAEGLLILCVGKATKLVNSFLTANKTYEGTVVLGAHYDTYDVTGTITKSNTPKVTKEQLEEVLKSFKGEYYQEPPMYSALKKEGKKLYEYARKGIDIKRDKRLVEIINLDLIKHLKDNEFTIDVETSKGTYIRSLAVDIAFKLNTYGALKTLKRTKVGKYSIKDSVKLEDLTINDIVTLEEFFKKLPKVQLNDYMIRLVKNGIQLDERQTNLNKAFIVVDKNDKMIAYYDVISENKYKPIIILGDEL